MKAQEAERQRRRCRRRWPTSTHQFPSSLLQIVLMGLAGLALAMATAIRTARLQGLQRRQNRKRA